MLEHCSFSWRDKGNASFRFMAIALIKREFTKIIHGRGYEKYSCRLRTMFFSSVATRPSSNKFDLALAAPSVLREIIVFRHKKQSRSAFFQKNALHLWRRILFYFIKANKGQSRRSPSRDALLLNFSISSL